LELFYHHTRPHTKSLLLSTGACQISCQSDTQIKHLKYDIVIHSKTIIKSDSESYKKHCIVYVDVLMPPPYLPGGSTLQWYQILLSCVGRVGCDWQSQLFSGVGTYLSGTARAVPLLKVGRLVMHFAVPLFGHRLHIALQVYMSNDHAACKFPHLLYQEAFSLHCLIYSKIG